MTWSEFGWLLVGLIYGYWAYPLMTVMKKVFKKANDE